MIQNSLPNKKSIKLLYWNIRSFNKRKLEIERMIKDYEVIICVESWLKPKPDTISFPGYITYRKDRINTKGGGLLIFVRNNIAFTEIKNIKSPSSVEMCGLYLSNISPPINLIVCYRAPWDSLSQKDWDLISENAFNNQHSILIGDFNAHNTSWNCKYSDASGQKFFNSIDKHDLLLHNPDTLTHIDVSRNSKSNIDLVLSSSNISDKIETEVWEETFGSDHYPITLSLNLDLNLYRKKSFKLNSLRTNWAGFLSDLENNYLQFFSVEFDQLSPSQKYDFFVKILSDAVRNNTPPKSTSNHARVTKKSNQTPWWDEECNKSKLLRKAALKKWNFTQNMVDLINYNKQCAITTRTFKIKKKENFKKFAESINIHTNARYVWNKCKIFKNKWVKITPPSLNENLNTGGKIESEINKLSPPWACTDPEWFPVCQNNDFLDKYFEFHEFNSTLNSTKIKSAPGPDGITYETLKNMPLKIKLILLDIYNELFRSGDYPISWKKSYIHFIDKPGNKGVRPISLTSCLCKHFEMLVKIRLQWWVEYTNVLPINQCGFRRGRSCSDNLLNLLLEVDESLSNKEEVFAAFLDVNSAFPSVNSDILLTKLADIGCSLNIIKLAKFLTHQRYIMTDLLGDQCRLVGKGLGQGGVLSPLFYLIYVAQIANNIPEVASISQFADDIEIHSKNKAVLENTILTVKNNLNHLGLELSPKKTVLIHFNNKNILPGSTTISIDNCLDKSSETARFLGITFDYNLEFSSHVNLIQKRGLRAFNIIKFLCGTWWGSHPDTLLILYKSFVRSIIDFGSFVYFPKFKKLADKLEKIQYAAIRASLGYRISTPKNILLAESKLQSIKERSKLLCNRFLAKSISNKSSPSYHIIFNYYDHCKKHKLKRKRISKECLENIMKKANKINKKDHFNIYKYNYKVLTFPIPVDFELGRKLQDLQDPNTLLDSVV